MARLSEQLGDFLSRVELLARGAEWHRAEALRALEAGRPWEAREHALGIVDELPRSRVGLALWADAAEAALLDREVVEALERLSAQLPFRADVWLRLGQARERLGEPAAEAFSRAAELSEPTHAADAARLWLADRDLSRSDAARAERWLEQLSLPGRSGPEAASRRIEVALELGEIERAGAAARAVATPRVLEGRAWLARARWLVMSGEADPAPAFVRALLLEVPGALSKAAAWIAGGAPPAARARLNAVVTDLGSASHPIWRAAFASAEGRPAEALAALAEGARASGEPELRERFLSAALEARDRVALAEAARLGAVPEGAAALLASLELEREEERLEALDRAGGVAAPWADAIRAEIFARWCGEPGATAWRELLGELLRSARELGDLEASREVEGIARDLDRPLRVAIVGEFNAGKSSLINALLGEDVAPVGVLPTTATLNTLTWAPDRFARIERRSGQPDRLVSHAELRSTLHELDPRSVERVTLFAPLDLLRKVELIDTPGFNAPEVAHAETARAAFREAHVVLWLLDATQPLKASERSVLEEVRAHGLPLAVLLNKIDRLPNATAIEAAREHARAGLAEAGLETEGEIVVFSAKRALAARVGDPSVLPGSGWPELERFVESVLVGRSAVLRERVLRRRARDLGLRFEATAEARSRRERERAEGLRASRERLVELGRQVGARRNEWVRRLSDRFAGPLAAYRRELAPVASLAGDRGARRFVERRAREVLARGLWDEIRASIELEPAELERLGQALLPRLEALSAGRAEVLLLAVRGTAEAGPDVTAVTSELAEIALDELVRATAAAAESVSPEPSSPLFLRTRGLARALSPR